MILCLLAAEYEHVFGGEPAGEGEPGERIGRGQEERVDLAAMDLPAILMGTAAVMTAAAKLIEAWRGSKQPPRDQPEAHQWADTNK
jgi:hypothetical protein